MLRFFNESYGKSSFGVSWMIGREARGRVGALRWETSRRACQNDPNEKSRPPLV